jgi:phospho-2-dehydro-3-deoxyheptonate aldolase
MKLSEKFSLSWNPGFAYALGLIATDGNLSPDGRHINLTSQDLELVLLFRKALGLENSIGKKARGYSTEKNVVSGIVEGQDEYRLVRGMMLESHLEGGKQSIQAGMNPRKSITDDCLGLSETVPLIRMIADMLDRRK